MSRPSSVRSWFSPAALLRRRRPARTDRRTTPRRGPGLAIEQLEDRLVPATITVTSFADGEDYAATVTVGQLNPSVTPVTLTDAIHAANNTPGDTTLTGNTAGASGGGIATTGTLTVSFSTLTGNSTSNNYLAGYGGGIYAQGSSTVTFSTLRGNDALFGAGIFNGATLTLTNSTLSGNQAVYDGGGLFALAAVTGSNCTFSGNEATSNGGQGGGIADNTGAALTLTNCTIAYNRLPNNNNSSAYSGAGLYVLGNALLHNTIVDGNYRSSDPLYYFNDDNIGGNAVNSGSSYNLVGPGSFAGLPDTGYPYYRFLNHNIAVNFSGSGLTPLGNYGGPTQTIGLLPASPALDRGDDSVHSGSNPLSTDQRGLAFPRQAGTHVDIGAFESAGFTLTLTGNNQSASVNTSFANPLVVQVSANDPNLPVDSGRLNFIPPSSGPSASLTGFATIDGTTLATIGSNGQASVTAQANGATGTYAVTLTTGNPEYLTSFDPRSQLNTAFFTLTNVATPSFTRPGDQGSNEADHVSLQVNAANATSFRVTGLPPGLAISGTGLIAGTIDPRAADGSPYNVTVTASNSAGSAQAAFHWTVFDTVPPALAVPAGQTNRDGDTVSVAVPASTDADRFSATGLPPGLGIDPTTGTISGTIGDGTGSPYTVTLTAYDGTLSTSQEFTWTVHDADPLQLLTRSPLTVTESSTGNVIAPAQLSVGGTDDAPTAVTYTLVTAPRFGRLRLDGVPWGASGSFTQDDVNNGRLTYDNNAEEGAGADGFTFTAADSDGSSVGTTAFVVQVHDVVPAINVGGPATLAAGQALSRAGSFVDPSADTWTATVNYGDGSSGPLTLSGHTFTLNHTYTSGGNHTVTVTLTDDDGTAYQASFAVQGGTPPTVQSVVINDGSAQRSMVDSITVTFSTQVDLAPGAFTLVQAYAGSHNDVSALVRVSTALTADGRTVATLTFAGAGVYGGSLADGRYTLTTRGGLVHDHALATALDGAGDGQAGSDRVDQFFRLFGDVTGDGQVDDTDRTAFLAAYRSRKGMTNYRWYLDVNDDGFVDSVDYYQLLRHYRTKLNADGTVSPLS
jgi:predicted outer membrane repeat protein